MPEGSGAGVAPSSPWSIWEAQRLHLRAAAGGSRWAGPAGPACGCGGGARRRTQTASGSPEAAEPSGVRGTLSGASFASRDTPTRNSVPQPVPGLGDALRCLGAVGGYPQRGRLAVDLGTAFRCEVRRWVRPDSGDSLAPDSLSATGAAQPQSTAADMRTATAAGAPGLFVVRGWDVMVGSSQPERSGGWAIALSAKRSTRVCAVTETRPGALGDRLRCRYGRPRTGLRSRGQRG